MDPEPMQPFQIYFTYIVILEHFASSSDIWMPCFALICNKKGKGWDSIANHKKCPLKSG